VTQRPRPTRDDLAELGLLAATLLHELRQPVFAIKALAALARRESDGPVADKLARLLEQVDHVEGLLEVYGPLGGRHPTDEVFDLAAEVRRAVQAVEARRDGVAVEVALPTAPMSVRGHPLAARQVLVNLVDNAYDAVASCAQRRVRVEGALLDGMASVVVHDTGPGLPDEVLARLFEPFVTTKAHGTGLGLFVSSRLVAEVGGELVVETAPGGGARATLSWPLLRT